MADCLQSKYTYKGKEYTLEELANRFAEGELAKLASDGVVDLSDFIIENYPSHPTIKAPLSN
jgi:thymidylate synthase